MSTSGSSSSPSSGPSPTLGAAASVAELKRAEREWQDRVGQGLLDLPHQAPGSAMVFRRQFDRVLDRVPLRAGECVVEVGCGRGHFLTRLRERYAGLPLHVIGVDLSRAVFALPTRGLTGVQGDGEALPFRSASVSLLVYDGALHHLIDYAAALAEAHRVLAPGGRLLLFEPVSSPFTRLVHRVLDPFVFRHTVYESPIDQECKDEFREEVVLDVLRRLDMRFTLERSDAIAYPVTGCYAGGPLGSRPRAMQALLRAEEAAWRVPGVRQILGAIAWRFLIVAHKRA